MALHDRVEEFPFDYATPPVLDIHTCDMNAIVNINGWMQNALKEDCSLHDDRCTEFDVWLHTQLVLTNYNNV